MRGKQKKPTKSDADKKADKAEYERERYQRNRKKVLKQQADYYKENKTDIRERREDYWKSYNKRYKKKVDPATDKRFKHWKERE